MKENKSKNILIIILTIIVILLIIAVIYLGLKNEFLEEKYEYLKDNNYNINLPENNNDTNNNSNNNNSNYISKDTALDIALKDLKINNNAIRDLDIEMEYKAKYGKSVYEVSFDYLEYEYYIDPTSGKILDSFKSLS